jgi:F-type H+-transporting ATPase subunit delta
VRSREIASRYAGALYEVASEDGSVPEIAEELRVVVEEIRDVNGFGRFLTHPLISREKKTDLVEAAFPALSSPVANMVRLLIQNRREGYLDLIYDAFLEARSAAENLARVQVATAKPLGEEDRIRLQERLEQALGKSVSLEVRAEEGLLAGARIEVEGRTIDASLRAKLRELRHSLER